MKIIGVSGGSGSGKTTFTRLLSESLGSERVAVLGQDSYYTDQSQRFDKDGGSVNFDHPDSIDWILMGQHLKSLKEGRAIEVPIYEFSTHRRLAQTVTMEPKPIVLLDGILILVRKEIRDLIDFKIFIQTNENLRLARRTKRDTIERGRTAEGVQAQWTAQVKPMHDKFVEPTCIYADMVLDGEESFLPQLERLSSDFFRKFLSN